MADDYMNQPLNATDINNTISQNQSNFLNASSAIDFSTVNLTSNTTFNQSLLDNFDPINSLNTTSLTLINATNTSENTPS
jgi:hypothetical protein